MSTLEQLELDFRPPRDETRRSAAPVGKYFRYRNSPGRKYLDEGAVVKICQWPWLGKHKDSAEVIIMQEPKDEMFMDNYKYKWPVVASVRNLQPTARAS